MSDSQLISLSIDLNLFTNLLKIYLLHTLHSCIAFDFKEIPT